jgi:hypothetical protein
MIFDGYTIQVEAGDTTLDLANEVEGHHSNDGRAGYEVAVDVTAWYDASSSDDSVIPLWFKTDSFAKLELSSISKNMETNRDIAYYEIIERTGDDDVWD